MLDKNTLVGVNRHILKGVALAIAYALVAYIGLNWATVRGAGSPVWPAAGIAFAGLILGGVRLWPAIFVGRLLAAWMAGSGQPFWADALIAAGNSVSAVLPVLLLRWFAVEIPMIQLRSLFRYLVICAGLGSLIAATIGASILALSTGLSSQEIIRVFSLWAIGNFAGAAIVGPFIISWSKGEFRREPATLFLILTLTVIFSWILFLNPPGPYFHTWHLLPLFIWAALTYQLRGASAALLIAAVFAVIGITLGYDVVAVASLSVLGQISVLQQFLSITAVAILFLAAIDEERHLSGEEKLREALDAAGQGTFEMDLAQRKISFDPQGLKLHELQSPLISVDMAETLKIMHPEDRKLAHRAIRPALNTNGGGIYQLEYRVVLGDGSVRWLAIRGKTVFRGSQSRRRPTIIRGTIRNITSRKIAEAESRRLTSIIEHTPDFIAVADADAKINFVNPGGLKLVGWDKADSYTSKQLADWHPRPIAEMLNSFAIPVAGEKGYWEGESVLLHNDGSSIPVNQTIIAHRNEKGTIEHYSTIVRDVTQSKRASERQSLLLRELSHRVKNTLAVVQSIARRTAGSISDPIHFAQTFQGRIDSLAHSHALLTDNDWRGAMLKDLLVTQLRSVGSDDRNGEISLEGPDVLMPPEIATNVGLGLHELATNAAIHGGLSTSNGNIDVNWNTCEHGVALRWCERNPSVSPVAIEQKGFGTKLIQSIFPGIKRTVTSEGLQLEMVIRLNQVQEKQSTSV